MLRRRQRGNGHVLEDGLLLRLVSLHRDGFGCCARLGSELNRTSDSNLYYLAVLFEPAQFADAELEAQHTWT